MSESDTLRGVLDQAESGAPAAGHAVRDIFSTDEIFRRIVATADEEFQRSGRLLFLSGLAAGLSIGLSLLARATMTAHAGGGDEAILIGNLLYPVGFLLIVLGRYQLFTENPLTPVTLVMTRIASIPLLLRVWGIVLVANLMGAAIAALMFTKTSVMEPKAMDAAIKFGNHALEYGWQTLFWKGLVAGWLVASMVCIVHAARETITRLFAIFIIMYLIPTADLFHCIIGACEVLMLEFNGQAAIGELLYFLSAVVLGNTVGGVLLVAILNYAQTRVARFPDRDLEALRLSWREWLFGSAPGRPDLVPGSAAALMQREAEADEASR